MAIFESIVNMKMFYRWDKMIDINSYFISVGGRDSHKGEAAVLFWEDVPSQTPTASTIISNIAKYQSSLPLKDP